MPAPAPMGTQSRCSTSPKAATASAAHLTCAPPAPAMTARPVLVRRTAPPPSDHRTTRRGTGEEQILARLPLPQSQGVTTTFAIVIGDAGVTSGGKGPAPPRGT